MDIATTAWRVLLQRVETELNPKKRLSLCQEARQRMQERMIEITQDGASLLDDPEQCQIEEALRKLWSIEEALS